MDKQEYREIVSDIRSAYDRQEYDKVLMYADELELKKVSDSRVLEMIADAYASVGETETAMELLEKAYEKTPMGRKLAYKLSELSIEMGNLDEAVRYYEDFRKMSPHDNSWILLKYKIGKAGGVPEKDLVKALAAYCSKEVDEQWMAELAELYDELGDTEKCNEVCDDIILWFADGIYVQKALELKERNGVLTEAQHKKLLELQNEAAAPAVSAEPSVPYSGERELRPGSLEEEDLSSEDLDSILEEFITIEDATAPPQRMHTADLTEAMSGKEEEAHAEPKRMGTSDLSDALSELDDEIVFQEILQPETEVIPVEQIRQVERDSAAAEEEIRNAKAEALKAAELENAIEEVIEDADLPEELPLPSAEDIILEEMELKTAPVHEEVQEMIAGNMDHPEPEDVPDILYVPETEEAIAASEPEDVPAEDAVSEPAPEPLFTSVESNGKPFSNIEALQIARTAPPKDEASFWKMPEELSIGEEPVREEFTEPVYGSHRWFEQPQEPDPDFEEPVFGAHRFVPQPEMEEEEIGEDVTIEQVAPEPIVIEQAEEEDYFQPHVSTIRTTSSGAELAGLYANAKYAEQEAQLSDQAALVRKPSLGIKKVLPPEMFADPITEPEYYEGPVYFSDEESGAKQPEPEEEAKPEAEDVFVSETNGPVIPDVFGHAEPKQKEEEAEPKQVDVITDEAAFAEEEPEAEELPEPEAFEPDDFAFEASKQEEPVDSEFEKAIREFDQEQKGEAGAMAAETEFIPSAVVSDIIKEDLEQEGEIDEAGSEVLDELFTDSFTDEVEERIRAFDREQQKEADEQSELAQTIQELKQRILELELAQNIGRSEPGENKAEEILTAEADSAAEVSSEEKPTGNTFTLDSSVIEEILAEEENNQEAENEPEEVILSEDYAEPEEAPKQNFGETASVARIFAEDFVTEEPEEEAPSGLTQIIRFIDTADEEPEEEPAEEEPVEEEPVEEEPAETEPAEEEIPEETYEEPVQEGPSPFMFSVMPHESVEEVVPEILLERQRQAAVEIPEEPEAEPEAEPSIFVPAAKTEEEPKNEKVIVPAEEGDFEEPSGSFTEEEPVEGTAEAEPVEVTAEAEPEPEEGTAEAEPEAEVQEEAPFEEDYESGLFAFEDSQQEDEFSEFERVVQDFELSNRAEDYWEDEVIEEPQVDEAPIVEITGSIPQVEEPGGLTQVIRFIDTADEEPEETEQIPEEEPVVEPETEYEPEPEEEYVPDPDDVLAELEKGVAFEPETEASPWTDLSDFEKAMLAFEENSEQIPEEEFSPEELDEAMESFLDESVEPWEEPEFGMPEFEASEFEKPEFLGNDFDEPESFVPEEPGEAEEPEIPEEPVDEEELLVERELSDFEKALLAFDGEAAKAELEELRLEETKENVSPAQEFVEPELPQPEPEVIAEEEAEVYEETEPEAIAGVSGGYQIPDDMRAELSEFLLINGMEGKICHAVENIVQIKRYGDPTGGHLIITGDAKSGKTYLTISLIKAVGKEIGSSTGRVAKVQADSLNGKDMNKVFVKIKGSDLIIENAGYLSDETVERLMEAMKNSGTSSMVVLEGNELGIENLLIKHPELTEIFQTRLDLAELSLAEWADLAVEYAKEQGYEVGDMALLALHAKIDEMNLPTTRLVVEDVQNIIDNAIAKAKRRTYGRHRSRKKGRDTVLELDETDFM